MKLASVKTFYFYFGATVHFELVSAVKVSNIVQKAKELQNAIQRSYRGVGLQVKN